MVRDKENLQELTNQKVNAGDSNRKGNKSKPFIKLIGD